MHTTLSTRFYCDVFICLYLCYQNNIKNIYFQNVRIYGVQCRGYNSTKDFYKKMSTATDGKCLELADFSNMFDFMMAICYREHDETLLQVHI